MTTQTREQWRRIKPFALGAATASAVLMSAYFAFVAVANGPDADGDGMSDDYESLFGLNPTNPADASLDYDGDELVNLQEYSLNTDPFAADTDRDGWNDNVDSNPLSRVYIKWGDPAFTAGDDYRYAAPAWWVRAYAIGGEWQTNEPTAWHVPASASNGVASLQLDVDRSILTNDLVMKMDLFDHTDGSLHVDLVDTNGAAVATDLFGNLMTGSNQPVQITADIPLESYPEAAGISIYRASGEITVYTNRLYVDKDHDGFDADQELQLGTSDNNPDSDGDGLTDYAEVFILGTSPTKADTDGDGLSDGAEVNTFHTDPTRADTDSDGIRDAMEVFYGTDPAVSNTFSIVPFLERFETDTMPVGPIDGWNNWTASPPDSVHVRTNTVYEGSQALEIDQANAATCLVRHVFASPATNAVWLDMYVRGMNGATPAGAVDSSMNMYFDSRGRLVVYDGNYPGVGQWVTLTNHPPVDREAWARLTVKLDYAAQQWLVCLNSVPVAQGLGFASGEPAFSGFALEGEQGLFDRFEASTTVPAGISLDGDTLPDAWELQAFGDLEQGDTGDADHDGLSNLQEYQLGLNPSGVDSDSDGADDFTEWQWGGNPANADTYPALPWSTEFEADQGYAAGGLNGQQGWHVLSGAAVVQTGVVCSNLQALSVQAPQGGLAAAGLILASVTNSVIWTDYAVQMPSGPLPSSAVVPPRATAVTAVNPAGFWAGLDGSGWLVATNAAVAGGWSHVTIRENFAIRQWDLYIGRDRVLTGLSFADTNADHFARFAFLAASPSNSYLDSLNIAATPPGHIDIDGDGLDNAREWTLGTNPYDPDTDHDGMDDATELKWGFDPLVSNAFFRIDAGSGTNTWMTGFEPEEGYAAAALAGQNGWAATNLVMVVNTQAHAGVQSVLVPSAGGSPAPVQEMEADIGAAGRTQAWVTFHAKLQQGSILPDEPGPKPALDIYLCANRLYAYDGSLNAWKASANEFAIGSDTWTRIDLQLNHATRKYAVCLNGVLAVDDVGFGDASLAVFSRLKISGSPTAESSDAYVDDVRISTDEPAGLDFDGDGLSNFQEYQLGTNPKSTDSDGDGMPDKWEVDNGLAPTTGADALLDPDADGLLNLEEYQAGTDPHNVDSDGDGLLDGYEVHVSHTDPLNADTDGDGLSDYWEVRSGLDPLVVDSLAADSDGDGLSNAQEAALGSNPYSVDSDGDGLSDAWENANGLNVVAGRLTSLVSWWRFDEASGSVAYDDNRQWRNDGRLEDGALRTPLGHSGHALALDGKSGYARVPDNVSLDSTLGLTLAMWVKLSAFDSMDTPVFFASKEDAAGHVEFALSYVESAHALRFSHANASNQRETVSVVSPLSAGLWTHLAVAVSNNQVAFYVDGVQQGAAQSLSYVRSHLGGLVLGSTLATNAVDPVVNGSIDEVRFYNAALSPAQIAAFLEAEGDPDTDGLDNLAEFRNGTSPAQDDATTDSDGDGLSNLAEITVYHTDPFNADSDGDGVSDGAEVANNTNPLVADQGSNPNGPVVTVIRPEEGEKILW